MSRRTATCDPPLPGGYVTKMRFARYFNSRCGHGYAQRGGVRFHAVAEPDRYVGTSVCCERRANDSDPVNPDELGRLRYPRPLNGRPIPREAP